MTATLLPLTTEIIHLSGISWQTYETLLKELSDRHLRLTYNRGNLEIMAPSPENELSKTIMGRFVETLAEELDIQIHPKVALFDTQKRTYEHLLKALVSQGKIEQALEVAERGRARAFVELLASRAAGGPSQSPRSQALEANLAICLKNRLFFEAFLHIAAQCLVNHPG